MQWGELTRETQDELLKLAENLLKSESGAGRPARCATCYYWQAWESMEYSVTSGGSGECRRRAPQNEHGFTVTRANEWCGDGRMLTVDDLAWRIWAEQQRLSEVVE
jgi:hypothetical protein